MAWVHFWLENLVSKIIFLVFFQFSPVILPIWNLLEKMEYGAQSPSILRFSDSIGLILDEQISIYCRAGPSNFFKGLL